MKAPHTHDCWFFVDESGDPTFYDSKGNLILGQGCSNILILGFIKTTNPIALREKIIDFHSNIVLIPEYQNIPSLKKTKIALHAKDDYNKIRDAFFEFLVDLDFSAQFIVARKIEKVFRNNFQAKEGLFYGHLISQLFERVLHVYQCNHIYFAHRGSTTRQEPLIQAINQAISAFEHRSNRVISTNRFIHAQTPSGEPCLSIIDYMNWAVQRAFVRGDMKYYDIIRSKISLVVDLYEPNTSKSRYYNRKNPFDIKKITPL